MRKQLFKRRTLILFTLMFIGLSSMGYAQKVSLNSSQQSLKQVLESISRQTGYTLAYSKEGKHPKSAVFLFHNQTLIFALKKVCSV